MNKLVCLFSLIFFLSFCSVKKTTIETSDASKDPSEIIERVNFKNHYPEWLSLKGRVDVFQNNKRALKTYTKCGFVEEGVKRESVFIDGEFINVVQMSILSKEFFK